MSHAFQTHEDDTTPVERAHELYERAAAQLQGRPPDDIHRLAPDLRLAYLVSRFHHEFKTGGLSGLLYNSTPELLRRTVEALELIRAPSTAHLLHRAARAWCRGRDLPATQEAYAAYWPLDPATHDALHALAQSYDPHAEDLDRLLDAHLRRPAIPPDPR